uniref:Si:busm1-57f23.1 n=1 Tax=Cynoglossus semilaevis TaxID=244447 RepID=A0A3P8X2N9_CYNSE
MNMFLPLSLLMCVSAVQLSVGDESVEEILTSRTLPVLGGWVDRSPDSAEIQAAVQYSLEMFNSRPKNKRMFKLVSVKSARSKVTNTINFKIDVILRKTKCLRSENQELDTCALTKKQLKCLFEGTFDPRNDKYELYNHKCKKMEMEKV